MALTIKIKRATRAQLNTAAAASELIQGEPYLITDEDRIAVGLSTTTYETFSKEVFWVTAPATKTSTGIAGQTAKDGNYLYVCTATNTWKRTAMATNW